MEKFIPEILRGSSCPVHCPLCQARLNITNIHSANCLNGHQFDFAAPGFIDLLAGSGHSIYNIELAIARRSMIINGLYDGLERELLRLLYAEYKMNDTLTILDAGTGDGALFSNILMCMRWDMYRHHAIGIDRNRSILKGATRNNQRALWLVADIKNMPLHDESVDVILNTMSPAGYEEFNRVLKPGGLLIKTIPGPHYDGPLQEAHYQEERSYEQSIAMINRHFGESKESRVRYEKEFEDDLAMPNLLQQVSIDVRIICGRKAN